MTTTTDHADRYRRLAAEFTRRVDAVRPDQWDLPSTCEEWTVRGVLEHVITSEHAMLGPVDLTTPLTIDIAVDPAGAWAELRDLIQGVLDDPAKAGREYDSMFGRTTLSQTMNDFGGFDLLVHGWDIARSTGQDDALPADEVEVVLAMTDQLGDMLRSPGVCGPEVPVGDDAEAQERLLGRLGRQYAPSRSG